MMNLERKEALNLLHQYVKNEKMIIHSLESEAVMRALALRLGRDAEIVNSKIPVPIIMTLIGRWMIGLTKHFADFRAILTIQVNRRRTFASIIHRKIHLITA